MKATNTAAAEPGIGDRMYWLSTGAYTTATSAIEFNRLSRRLEAFYV